jgi:hypothetical protein
MARMNNEISKLRKNNNSLHIKLQFEGRNNAMLLKNINRMRTNYLTHNLVNNSSANDVSRM